MTDQEIEQVAEKVVSKILEESTVSVLDVNGHGLLLHFTEHEMLGSALILDEAKVKANPCNCFSYKERDYCFAGHGAIGLLSTEQQELCKAGKVYKVKPGLKQRFQKFSEAASAAKKRIQEVPKGERLGPWLHAMGEELAQRGVQV
jgi:hypothetical protein